MPPTLASFPAPCGAPILRSRPGAARCAGRSAIVICQRGKKLSDGVAAWLRQLGATAETLEGGHEAWTDAGLPGRDDRAACRRANAAGRTVWVTRARPKIDRIACPWLIRRFVDPGAVFLFVAPQEVEAVGDRFGAVPFDIENVFWSHRGDLCTFDVMVEEFGLASRTAAAPGDASSAAPIPHGPTWRPKPPDCSPFRSACRASTPTTWRSSRQALTLYDALYRWCRDATGETHNWPNAKAAQ